MAVSSDAFDGVLPRGRGSRRDERDTPRSPLERARRLVASVADHRGSLLRRVGLERRLADELGLELRPGYWTDADGEECWALCAVYCDGECVGFSDLSGEGACGLLRFDEPSMTLPSSGPEGWHRR